MNARLRTGLGVLALALLAVPAGADEGAGTHSPLMAGVGARAAALGHTGVATGDGAELLFWNPARLATLDRGDFRAFHSKLYLDGAAMQAGYLAWPTLDAGAFGLGFARLGVDGIERRDDRNALLGDFGSGESHLSLGYARPSGPLLLGAAARLVQQDVDGASATGFGLDLSAALERPIGDSGRHRWMAGANLQNIVEPSLRLDQEEVPDPRVLRLGLGYAGSSASGQLHWLTAADLQLPREADARAGAGLELGYQRLLFLRGGVDGTRPTFGFGVAWSGVRVDYAMLSGDELDRNDRFTLALQFGAGVQARRDARQAAREAEVGRRLEDLLHQREASELASARALAQRAFAAGEHEEALRQYRRVELLAPGDPEALESIDASERELALASAEAHLAAREWPVAAASFQSVLTRWEGDARATRGLERARAAMQASADREAQEQGIFRDALDRFAAGDLEAARNLLDELLRLSPDHELGLEFRGRVVAQLAERRAAQERQRQAALAAAERAEAERQQRAAGLAREQRERGSAEPAPRRLDATERAQLQERFDAGLAAFQAGEFDRATRHWQAVWDIAPGFNEVGGYLVRAYQYEAVDLYGRGEYDAALDRCRRVLDIEPGNEKAHRYLARIQEEQTEIEALDGRGR